MIEAKIAVWDARSAYGIAELPSENILLPGGAQRGNRPAFAGARVEVEGTEAHTSG